MMSSVHWMALSFFAFALKGCVSLTLQQRVHVLESALFRINQKMFDLESQNGKARFEAQKGELEELKQRVEAQVIKIDELSQTVETQGIEIGQLKEKVQHCEDEIMDTKKKQMSTQRQIYSIQSFMSDGKMRRDGLDEMLLNGTERSREFKAIKTDLLEAKQEYNQMSSALYNMTAALEEENNTEAPFENLARHGTATQSSMYEDCHASKAIDGKKFTHYSQCTHTLDEADPWWMVDLGAVAEIDSVSMLNRGDACAERLTNIAITAGVELDSLELCGRFDGHADLAEEVLVNCSKGLEGRYLKISGGGKKCNNHGDSQYSVLTLCEVEVWGHFLPGCGKKSRCPDGWKFRECSSCYFVSKRESERSDAKAACAEMGGYLVEIDSAEETDFIVDIIQEDPNAAFFWAGGIHQDKWLWENSVQNINYTNWRSGEPNNHNDNENCLEITKRAKWNDRQCDVKLFYVCEREPMLVEENDGL